MPADVESVQRRRLGGVPHLRSTTATSTTPTPREIDYDDLLKDMKEGTEDSNAARKKAGYAGRAPASAGPSRRATTPRRRSSTGPRSSSSRAATSHTLNYDVRVLGREGVLSMNAVAPHGPARRRSARDMRPLIEVAEFNEGYRYAEFNTKTDKLAEYGLGALIAGGVAAKLGLFGKLFALLLAFKKIIIVGVIAHRRLHRQAVRQEEGRGRPERTRRAEFRRSHRAGRPRHPCAARRERAGGGARRRHPASLQLPRRPLRLLQGEAASPATSNIRRARRPASPPAEIAKR